MSYVKAAGFIVAYFTVGGALMAALFGPLWLLGEWWLIFIFGVMFAGLIYLIEENFR